MVLEHDQLHDCREQIDRLREENLRFYNTDRGRGALRDLQQTFPHPWLYVSELLQNAIDAKATTVSWKVDDDGLIFEHNGSAFTCDDVKALCTRGVSQKGVATIGFMGIGFKAVFRSFQRVRISSGSWRFCLEAPVRIGKAYGEQQRDWLGTVLPKWDDTVAPPSSGMTCRFVLSDRLDGLGSIEDDLERVLGKDRGLLPILALQGVIEVLWNGKHWLLNAERKEPVAPGLTRTIVTAVVNEGNCLQDEEWIVFSKEYRPSKDAIRRLLEHRQCCPSTEDEQARLYEEASRTRLVEVFCRLDNNRVPILPDPGRAFAVLPTDVFLPIRLYLQADWLLVTSRRTLIDLDCNPWHEEILDCVPELVAELLLWTVHGAANKAAGWECVYEVLPDFSEAGQSSQEWFLHERFRERLRQELCHRPIIPVYQEDGSIGFVSPSEAVVVPEAFSDFDDARWHPWSLFGDKVASRRILGQRGCSALTALGFLAEIEPDALRLLWGPHGVQRWLDLFEEPDRMPALIRLLAALGAMNGNEQWASTDFVCVLTETGSFTSRQASRRLPLEWKSLGSDLDGEILAQLKTLAGDDSGLVSSDLWQRVLGSWRDPVDEMERKARARAYLERISAFSLEELVEKWWESIPEVPTKEQVDQVVRFTWWVRGKQVQRRNLVKKVLCIDHQRVRRLIPIGSALLAEPYAGQFRRRFFPDVPVIAPEYLESDPFNGTVADWRSFFESGSPTPMGPFFLESTVETYSDPRDRDSLEKRIGRRPPDRRSSRLEVPWRQSTLRHDEYKLLDFRMPDVWRRVVAEGGDPDCARDVVQWMAETPGPLRENKRVKLTYVPPRWNMYYEHPIDGVLPSWCQQLSSEAWVPVKRREEVLRPCDVLDKDDPARPDAPVADMPPSLVETLKSAGILFGSNVPDAPAVMRLRAEGPTATIERLAELVSEAIEEASEDDNSKRHLVKLLREVALLPASPSDPHRRVCHDRIALRAGRGGWRSDLGGWVISVEEFPRESTQRSLLEQVHKFCPFPESTTGEQALAFLVETWRQEPEAERVRRSLPYAYEYLQQDLSSNERLVEQWNGAKDGAKVFTQHRRQWMPVAGNEQVYYDDLADSSWLDQVDRLAVATPGHLGRSPEQRERTAQLLGLRRLSERFQVEVSTENERPAPPEWQAALVQIHETVRVIQAKQEADEMADNQTEEAPLARLCGRTGTPSLTVAENMTVIVRDTVGDRTVSRKRKNAVYCENRLVVAGSPRDFAGDLAQVVVSTWGLSQRGELSARVAVLLTRIDDEHGFLKELSRLRETFGLPVVNPGASGGGRAEPEASARQMRDRADSPLSARLPHDDAGRQEPAPVSGPPGSATDTCDEHRPPDAIKSREKDPSSEGLPESREEGQARRYEDEPESGEPKRSGGETSPRRQHGSYTAAAREETMRHLLEQVRRLLAMGVEDGPVNMAQDEADRGRPPEGAPDREYRDAAMEYERKYGRYPEEKASHQPGFDIESYDAPSDNPQRRLIRRIEVKGRTARWADNEVVTLSRQQLVDALHHDPEKSGWDYWLYVVERNPAGHEVIAIQNPSRQAAGFELRGGTWREMAEASELARLLDGHGTVSPSDNAGIEDHET